MCLRVHVSAFVRSRTCMCQFVCVRLRVSVPARARPSGCARAPMCVRARLGYVCPIASEIPSVNKM